MSIWLWISVFFSMNFFEFCWWFYSQLYHFSMIWYNSTRFCSFYIFWYHCFSCYAVEMRINFLFNGSTVTRMAERVACFRLNPFENLAWEFWEFGLVSFVLRIIFNKLVPCYIKILRYEFQSLTCMSGLVTNEGNKPNLLSHKLFYKSPKLIYC